MHLQSDYLEILPVAGALKKRVTRAFESKAALSSSWWAEFTVDFTDELLRPGRFSTAGFARLACISTSI
jgi:hypothetical protein